MLVSAAAINRDRAAVQRRGKSEAHEERSENAEGSSSSPLAAPVSPEPGQGRRTRSCNHTTPEVLHGDRVSTAAETSAGDVQVANDTCPTGACPFTDHGINRGEMECDSARVGNGELPVAETKRKSNRKRKLWQSDKTEAALDCDKAQGRKDTRDQVNCMIAIQVE